jgi:hypothetical protein
MSKEIGEILRDRGMETALEATPEEYRSKAADMVLTLAQHGGEFTVETLRDHVGDPPRPGMMGAIIAAALRRNLIRSIGFVKAKRPSSRARYLQCFVGAVD